MSLNILKEIRNFTPIINIQLRKDARDAGPLKRPKEISKKDKYLFEVIVEEAETRQPCFLRVVGCFTKTLQCLKAKARVQHLYYRDHLG
jgi:hypothetical protein